LHIAEVTSSPLQLITKSRKDELFAPRTRAERRFRTSAWLRGLRSTIGRE
jgi:hypothetical protein